MQSNNNDCRILGEAMRDLWRTQDIGLNIPSLKLRVDIN